MAGRPRKDGPRHPCGKLVRTSPIPPEVLEKRRLLVGDRLRDDPRAGYPLGILFLRNAILAADHQAGLRYAGLHAAVWGNGAVKSHLETVIYGLRGRAFEAVDGTERERRMIKLAGELGEATAALHRLPTRRPYDVLSNIAIYERPMRFMDTSRNRSAAAWAADRRDLDALLEATSALAALWDIERRGETQKLVAE